MRSHDASTCGRATSDHIAAPRQPAPCASRGWSHAKNAVRDHVRGQAPRVITNRPRHQISDTPLCRTTKIIPQRGTRRGSNGLTALRCVNRIYISGRHGVPAAMTVTLSSVIAPPDGAPGSPRSRGPTELREFGADLPRAAPLTVVGADKQRSLRCAAALIITNCPSVSLTLMIQPFLSSWRSGRSGPLTGTSPGSVEAEGAVGSRALAAPSGLRVLRTMLCAGERPAHMLGFDQKPVLSSQTVNWRASISR